MGKEDLVLDASDFGAEECALSVHSPAGKLKSLKTR